MTPPVGTSLGPLHLVTDPRRDVLVVVRAALRAGVPVVQVRDKSASDRALFDLATRVLALCRDAGATCLVDDRADVALAVGADGVHVGDLDLPVPAVRRVLPGHVVGATCRDADAARARVREGATYLGVGPFGATGTKQGLPDPLGAAGIGAVAHAVAVPVIAIGGVTATDVPGLWAAGAHGVAVVEAVSGAADPERATRELLAALASCAGTAARA